ncbi:MAG: helix-turn-helix domain-containing protein [Robiginitomaculum sp.]|jgi:transposase|nr:helix-turn-helix domain-containing protein [Robiginitomaculum sp.]
MALSKKVRLNIVDLVSSGVSRREAARRLNVSASSAIRIVKQAKAFGHVEVKKPKMRRSKIDPYKTDICEWLTKWPILSYKDLCLLLELERGLHVPYSTMHDWMLKNQLPIKGAL